MTDPTSAEQKLAALRERFANSLPARRDAIEAALANNPTEAERLLHSLAGTAGTYGFHKISAIARRGEEGEDCVAELRASISGTASPTRPMPAPVGEPLHEPKGRILCVEDDPDQAAYVCEILRAANYETAVAHDLAEFARVVTGFRPDLLLLDVTLPDGSAFDLVAALRRAGGNDALPIVFLTGRDSLRARLDGIRAGGDDYLVKPVDRDLLLGTVAGRLERSRSVRTLLEQDAMTLAVTHATFLRSVRLAIDARAAGGAHYCLVMLDLDHFKNVNDRHGHLVGDNVLGLFGRFLRANVRAEDVVGRCGGEEFGVLLAGMTRDDASGLIERLLERFARIAHVARGAERFYVTFSAGVATLEPGDDAESWRQRADDALYVAKRGGRARVAAA